MNDSKCKVKVEIHDGMVCVTVKADDGRAFEFDMKPEVACSLAYKLHSAVFALTKKVKEVHEAT